MSWFRKKNKDEEIVFDSKKYLKEFDKHLSKKDERKYYNDMYDYVRKLYEDEISKDKNFIYHERVRLQAKTGKYSVMMKNVNTNLIILGLGFFANTITLAFSVSNYKSEAKFYIIFAIGFIAYSMILAGVYKNYEENSTFIFDLALQVLDDIEKRPKINNESTVIDEVAATIDTEEQSKPVKPSSQQANGNWNVEINMLSIMDAVGAVYKVGKAAKKMFRKKKS